VQLRDAPAGIDRGGANQTAVDEELPTNGVDLGIESSTAEVASVSSHLASSVRSDNARDVGSRMP